MNVANLNKQQGDSGLQFLNPGKPVERRRDSRI